MFCPSGDNNKRLQQGLMTKDSRKKQPENNQQQEQEEVSVKLASVITF